eukprot:TRINITY_DN5046_c0_g1_i3.p2 TRINITY_DN5046_c0_g1~~TRINITY_DN5046_c0_g1_i3.p2  ORF type:complete len:347 (-),score=53.55 TRINITY_DN5046_c0_g1_i3:1222-2262(-)
MTLKALEGQDYVLLVTFVFELLCGFSLVALSLYKVAADAGDAYVQDKVHISPPTSPTTSSASSQLSHVQSNNRATLKLSGSLFMPKYKGDPSSRLQLVLMGLVDMFSGLCCFMKVSVNLTGGNAMPITYLQWGVCTPPMIVVLCSVCSIDYETTAGLATFQAFIIFCGYMGTLYEDKALTFTWFALGAIMFVGLFSVLLVKKEQAVQKALILDTDFAKKKDIKIRENILRDRKLSKRLIAITLSTWCIYPIIWIVQQSGAVTNSSVNVAHSCLAFVAKLVFGMVLAWYRTRLGFKTVSLASTIGINLPTTNLRSGSFSVRSSTASSPTPSSSSLTTSPSIALSVES